MPKTEQNFPYRFWNTHTVNQKGNCVINFPPHLHPSPLLHLWTPTWTQISLAPFQVWCLKVNCTSCWLHICPNPLAKMIPSLQIKIRWRSWLFTLVANWPVTLTGHLSPTPEANSWNAEPNPEDDSGASVILYRLVCWSSSISSAGI